MTTGREAEGPPIIGLGEHAEGPATRHGLNHPTATTYSGPFHAQLAVELAGVGPSITGGPPGEIGVRRDITGPCDARSRRGGCPHVRRRARDDVRVVYCPPFAPLANCGDIDGSMISSPQASVPKSARVETGSRFLKQLMRAMTNDLLRGGSKDRQRAGSSPSPTPPGPPHHR